MENQEVNKALATPGDLARVRDWVFDLDNTLYPRTSRLFDQVDLRMGTFLAEQFDLDGPIDRWRAVRDEIHAEVCTKAFDTTLNSFVQSYESRLADASTLMIPLLHRPMDRASLKGRGIRGSGAMVGHAARRAGCCQCPGGHQSRR